MTCNVYIQYHRRIQFPVCGLHPVSKLLSSPVTQIHIPQEWKIPGSCSFTRIAHESVSNNKCMMHLDFVTWCRNLVSCTVHFVTFNLYDSYTLHVMTCSLHLLTFYFLCCELCPLCWNLYSVYCNLYPLCCNLYPLWCNLYPLCCNLYPLCCNLYPLCCNLYPLCCNLYPLCCNLYPLCCNLYPLCCNMCPLCCNSYTML